MRCCCSRLRWQGSSASSRSIANYVSEVETEVGDKIVVLELTKPAKANEAISDDMVTEKHGPEALGSRRRAARPHAARRRRRRRRHRSAKSILQEGMLVTPPEISEGEREVAILVDAATGVAGKIEPGRQVDVIAAYGADPADPENGVKAKPAPLDRDRPRREGDRGRHAAREARQQRAGRPARPRARWSRSRSRSARSRSCASRTRRSSPPTSGSRCCAAATAAGRTLNETIFEGQDPKKGDEGVTG